MKSTIAILLSICALIASPAQAVDEPCGQPTIDNFADGKSFLWQDCSTGRWHFRAAGHGGVNTLVAGSVTSDQPIVDVVLDSVEQQWGDVVNVAGGLIEFSVTVGPWYDGFEFEVPSDASASLSLDGSEPIYVGLDRTPLPTPFLIQGSGGAADLFEEVTAQSNINYVGESWAIAWGDVNSDGLPDVLSTHHRGTRASLYVNQGDGSFVDIGDEVLAANPSVHPTADQHGAAWADIDNDGDQDLLVQVGGNLPGNPRFTGQFYFNESGSLVEDGFNIGLDVPELRGRTPLWVDFNYDGLLDVVLASIPLPGQNNEPRIMEQSIAGDFLEAGALTGFDCANQVRFSLLSDFSDDGVVDVLCQNPTFPQRVYDIRTLPFADVTSLVPTVFQSYDAAVADFDGDLKSDLFITRTQLDESNALKSGTHTVDAVLRATSTEVGINFATSGTLQVTTAIIAVQNNQIYVGTSGVNPDLTVDPERAIFKSFTLSSFDLDAQGLASHAPGVENGLYLGYDAVNQKWQLRLSGSTNTAVLYVRLESGNPVGDVVEYVGFDPANLPIAPTLLINNGLGFDDRTAESGLDAPVVCSSVVAADFDNDMDPDIYMVCDNIASNAENIYYENLGGGIFGRRANAAGAPGSTLGVGSNVTYADYDLDGFLDLYVTNGEGEEPLALGPDQLYRNRGNGNHWVQFDLSGTHSNRDGIGARIFVSAGGVTQLREQGGGMHRSSQNHKRIHVGLGSNIVVDQVTVHWPSGEVQELTDLPADQVHTIVEPLTIPCGTPTIDEAGDAAALLWLDCATGAWNFRGTGNNGALLTYLGSIFSDMPFTGVELVSVEQGIDTVDVSDPNRIDFELLTTSWQDGFRFIVPAGANATLVLQSGNILLVGVNRTQLSMSGSRTVPFLTNATPGQQVLVSNEPAERRIFQRDSSGSYDLPLSGTHQGNPGTIEYRLVYFGINLAVNGHDWAVLDPAPGIGIWSGTIQDVPADNRFYRLQLRFSSDPSVRFEGGNRWGVGTLVGVIGQSGAGDFFNTEGAYEPDPAAHAVSRFFGGEWSVTGGDGAQRFGDGLAEQLGVAVGLLDYGAGSTSLQSEYDAGNGYWLDQSGGSKFTEFTTAVTNTGGSLELIVWSQGETEARQGPPTADDYSSALQSLRQNIDSAIAGGYVHSTVPMFLIQTGRETADPTVSDSGYTAVRLGQTQFAQSPIANAHLAAVTTDLALEDGTHLDAVSYTELGQRLADGYSRLLAGDLGPLSGPLVASWNSASDVLTDVTVTLRSTGAALAGPGSGTYTGFEVLLDGVGWVAVNGATPVAEDRVRLTHQSGSVIDVRYGYGLNPALENSQSNPANDPVLDTAGLPLAPFGPSQDIDALPSVTGAAGFNGVTSLQRRAPFVGLSNGKTGTLSFWIKPVQFNTESYVWVGADTNVGATGRMEITILTSGRVLFNLRQPASTGNALRMISTGGATALQIGVWHHVIAAWDNATGYARIYVDGVDASDSALTQVNADVEYQHDWTYIGAWGDNLFVDCCLAALWFDDSAVDLSIPAERHNFRTPTGAPGDLGRDGSTPTGSRPIFYFDGNAASFGRNRGIGGDLDVRVGGLADVAAPP